MEDGLNFSGLTVDNNGRARFSGLQSGIDLVGIVDQLVQARRIPIDRLEDEIVVNETKMEAYQQLNTLSTAFRGTLDKLRGVISLDNKNNAFEKKQAFANSSRKASLLSNGQTQASPAANLIGVTVSPAAQLGNYTIEVLRTAQAHRVSSESVSSFSDPLSASFAGFTGGTFELNDVEMTIGSNASMADLRDLINSSSSGVQASIVSAGDSEHYLVLTAAETGVDIEFAAGAGSLDALKEIGVLDTNGDVANLLEEAHTALMTAGGLKDKARYQSTSFQNPTNSLDTLSSGLIGNGSFNLSSNGTSFAVNYSSTDNVNDLINNINTAAGIAGSNIVASMEQNVGGSGFRLVIQDSNGDKVTINGDTGDLVSTMAFENPKIIERSSNTVDDLFTGITLNLFQAEAGTEIRIEVDRNLNEVKQSIVDFVDAYNELRVYANAQSQLVAADDQQDEDNQVGLLFGDRALSAVKSTLSTALSTPINGVDTAFSILAQIGVDFIDNQTVDDPILYETLDIDEAKLDEALLNNPEEVRSLFAFRHTSSNASFTVLGFDGQQTYLPSGLNINFSHDGTDFTSIDLDGDSSAVEVNGNSIKIIKGAATGMTIFYNNNGDIQSGGVNIKYTMGFAAKLTSEMDDLLSATGLIKTQEKVLEDLNTTKQSRITELTRRLEDYRTELNRQYTAMEAKISEAETIRQSIEQTASALQGNRK